MRYKLLMPPGDEDVSTSLESSTSEMTPPDTQVPAPEEASPPAESGADADQQSNEVTPASPAEKPDPVQEAMARLAKPEPQAKATKPEVQSKEPTANAQPKAAPEKATDAKPKAGPTLDDPYAGWLPTEQAKNLLKPQTRQRIEEIHHRWKDAEKRASLGTEFQTMLDAHNLNEDIGFVNPENLAGLLKAEAAVQRGLLAIEQGRRPAGADLQVFQSLVQQMDHLRDKFGIKPTAVPQPEVQPLQGQLPPEYQDLIDIYNLPEARVRMLAALEKSSTAKQPTPQAQPQATATPTQQPVDDRPEGVDMEALHARRLHGAFAKDGITADRFSAHQVVLEPIMQRIVGEEFPGLSKAQIVRVFNNMSAKERVDIALKAHAEYRAQRSAPVTPKPPQLPPPTRPPLQGTPGRKPPEIKGDALDSAIAFLARPAGE